MGKALSIKVKPDKQDYIKIKNVRDLKVPLIELKGKQQRVKIQFQPK